MTPPTVTDRVTARPRGQRAIRLPSGRLVSLGVYVAAWRTLLETPPDYQVQDWDHFATPAARVLDRMREGMHDRINRRLPWWGQGRRWDEDWQRDAGRCARLVNSRGLARLLVRPGDVPRDYRDRLAARITHAWEE